MDRRRVKKHFKKQFSIEMKKSIYRVLLFFAFIIWLAPDIRAQNNPPVLAEAMIGSEGAVIQILADKKSQSIPRLGFFTVTYVMSDWEVRDPADIMHQAGLTMKIAKGLDLVGGYHYTAVTGFRPSAALKYTFHRKNWLWVLNPRIDLTDDTNYEVFTNLQYAPPIGNHWKFLTKLQGLYVLSVKENIHQRSYALARIGLRYKEFAFGPGLNFDYFGPTKDRIINAGVFLSADLF